MHILFFTEFLPINIDGKISGGAESRTFYLAKALARKGHKITILTALLPNSLSEDNWDNITIFRVGSAYHYTQTGSFFDRFHFFLAAITQGIHINADIIDANSVPTYAAAWLVGLVKREKTVFWIPDVVGFRQTVRHFGVIIGLLEGLFELVSIALFRANKTIALSKTTKNKLVNLGFSENRLKIIYPGV